MSKTVTKWDEVQFIFLMLVFVGSVWFFLLFPPLLFTAAAAPFLAEPLKELSEMWNSIFIPVIKMLSVLSAFSVAAYLLVMSKQFFSGELNAFLCREENSVLDWMNRNATDSCQEASKTSGSKIG